MNKETQPKSVKSSAGDFTQGSIAGKLLRFMLPILGAQILQAMYGAVDLLVVGRFGSTAGISGVSTGSMVLNFVTFVIVGLSMGVTVLIGRYLGEGKKEKSGEVIGGAIWLFSIIAAVMTVVMLLFARTFARLMQAPEEALDLTVLYIRICGGGLIFIIAYNLIASIFRGLGDSKLPLIFVTIACVVNIFGDLLFVAVLNLNTAGAALATVFAQAVSVVLSLVIMKRRELPFTFSKSSIRFSSDVLRFVQIGSPLALQEALTQVSFLAICAFVNALGLTASGGYGVANKLVAFVMLLPGSLMQSMASFVAQNVGAGQEARAKRAMFTGMGIGGAIGVVVSLFVFFRGDLLCGIFSTDAAVIRAGWDYLRGFATEAVLTSILFSFIGFFNGHEQTLFVMTQGLLQTFIVRLPMSWFMSSRPNASLRNIGLAAPTATVFGIILNVVYFMHWSKKQKTRHSLPVD